MPDYSAIASGAGCGLAGTVAAAAAGAGAALGSGAGVAGSPRNRTWRCERLGRRSRLWSLDASWHWEDSHRCHPGSAAAVDVGVGDGRMKTAAGAVGAAAAPGKVWRSLRLSRKREGPRRSVISSSSCSQAQIGWLAWRKWTGKHLQNKKERYKITFLKETDYKSREWNLKEKKQVLNLERWILRFVCLLIIFF